MLHMYNFSPFVSFILSRLVLEFCYTEAGLAAPGVDFVDGNGGTRRFLWDCVHSFHVDWASLNEQLCT